MKYLEQDYGVNASVCNFLNNAFVVLKGGMYDRLHGDVELTIIRELRNGVLEPIDEVAYYEFEYEYSKNTQ